MLLKVMSEAGENTLEEQSGCLTTEDPGSIFSNYTWLTTIYYYSSRRFSAIFLACMDNKKRLCTQTPWQTKHQYTENRLILFRKGIKENISGSHSLPLPIRMGVWPLITEKEMHILLSLTLSPRSRILWARACSYGAPYTALKPHSWVPQWTPMSLPMSLWGPITFKLPHLQVLRR